MVVSLHSGSALYVFFLSSSLLTLWFLDQFEAALSIHLELDLQLCFFENQT